MLPKKCLSYRESGSKNGGMGKWKRGKQVPLQLQSDIERELELKAGGLTASRIVIEQLPVSLQNLIGPVNDQTLSNVSERLNNLSQTVDLIRGIAGRNREGHNPSLPYFISTNLILKTDQHGRIHYSLTPLLEALNGIEAARIRECPICRKIFWAGRIDRPCCSSKCAGTLRGRRWRERYGERYKQQRIQKENEKEALEHQKTKKGRK